MTISVKVADLQSKRAATLKSMMDLAAKDDFTDTDKAAFDTQKKAIDDLDAQITRMKDAQELAAKTAQPASGQDWSVPASPETDQYVKDKSLLIGAFAKTLAAAGGIFEVAKASSKTIYGESHPVTKAMMVSSGSAGGFLVPPDVMAEVIPLLRAQAVVRQAGPRNVPMPRGTMTMPGQNSGATAGYGSEGTAIGASQPSVGQIVASYKKLRAFVPISNDMMRYANPAIDAFVRDDLVRVIGLREDLAFLMGDGTQDTPRGYLSFANGWVAKNSGTVGVWSKTGSSTFAVNGADPENSTGGNFITANQTYTLDTVANELMGAINRLDVANVPAGKRVWFMNPRTKNYLANLRNSLGLYVYQEEMSKGTLLGNPFFATTQIGANYRNADSSNTDLSFIFLVEMTEDLLLDSMQLELAVSREATYQDASGATVSAFTADQTLIRAISEHDHQLRHDAAVAVIQAVRWAPAIS